MPSNKDLIEQAGELAIELNLAINTDGMNNEKLAALVKDLRAKQTDAETVTQADDAPEAAEKPRKGFFIAGGKSFTSKRGILGPGTEVTADDFAGGDKAIADFVKSKHIVTVG